MAPSREPVYGNLITRLEDILSPTSSLQTIGSCHLAIPGNNLPVFLGDVDENSGVRIDETKCPDGTTDGDEHIAIKVIVVGVMC